MIATKNDMMKETSKRTILLSVSVLCVLIIVVFGLIFLKKEPHPQNVILISFDNLRADRLGCYGNERDVSPFLDQLAQEGKQFLWAFTAWPYTPPSHLSLLTSLYPEVFAIPLDSEVPTLAKVLSDQGYKTAAFTAGGYMSSDYGAFSGFQECDDSVYRLRSLGRLTRRWLKSHKEEKFFLFLHTYYIHTPFTAPKEYFLKFADPNYEGPVDNIPSSTIAFLDAANRKEIEVTPDDIQRILDVYDAQIRNADDFLRRLVQDLKDMGLLENTLVVVTSDHGEQFYEFGYFAHSSPERRFPDISTRVPLIFSCPLFEHRGIVEPMVELIDVAPTILDAVGADIPETFQGQSLYPVLKRKKPRWREAKKEVFFITDWMMGVRTHRYKLTLRNSTGEIQLFDLLKDPQEKKDISQEPEQDEIIRSLVTSLEAFQDRNSALRKQLGLQHFTLEEGLPESPLLFDDDSLILASFDDRSIQFSRTGAEGSLEEDTRESLSEMGKFGKALIVDSTFSFFVPPETPLFGRSGAIEFWLNEHKDLAKGQKMIKIVFSGDEESLFLDSKKLSGIRREFVIKKSKDARNTSSVRFTLTVRSGRWNHFLLSWEEGEMVFMRNGALVSQKKVDLDSFFPLEKIRQIKIRGEAVLLDDLRISKTTRIIRGRDKKKIDLRPEVKERLKALGYIK